MLLASVLLIAASVGISTTVVIERMGERSRQAVMDLESDHTERLASLLGNRIVALQLMLRAVATAMPEAARHDAAAAVAYLATMNATATQFASLVIAAPDGRVLALRNREGTQSSPLRVDDRAYFRDTLASGRPLVSAPLQGRVSGEPIIQLTMPLPHDRGGGVGVLGGALRLASHNLIDDLTHQSSDRADRLTTIVADATGTIVSHPTRSRILGRIQDEPLLAGVIARWVEQGSPIEPTGQTVHENGLFVSMAGVSGADWMVFRIAPDQALLGGVTAARREGMVWAGAVALFGGLLLVGLLTLLLGPMNQLRRRAQALQDHALPLDAGWPETGGEIGELTRVLRQVLEERAAGEAANLELVQRLRSLMAAAPIGIAFTRGDRFELLSVEFNTLFGYAQDELLGARTRITLAHPEEHGALTAKAMAAFVTGRPLLEEVECRRRDGSAFWARLQGRPVEAGNLRAGAIWLLEDVTESRAARARLAWSAQHDALTRLLNRGAFEQRLSDWLAAQPAATSPDASAAGDASERHGALMFIDLDRFKEVNDNAGHAAGDRVLREVAVLLESHVRADGDAVARLGGDEFALWLPDCSTAAALQLGERLRAGLSAVGVEHAGRRWNIGASIGVAPVRGGGGGAAGPGHWIEQADGACYAAKRAGRNAVRLANSPAWPAASAAVAVAVP